MSSRFRRFLSYYRPYAGLFASLMACAFIVSATTLVLPLCIRNIAQMVLDGDAPDALGLVYRTASAMLALVAIRVACGYYVDYRGHAMGAMMEADMRRELFAHSQKLPFGFYDEQRTGRLMSRLTNDLLSIAELAHHGPEDTVINVVRFVGAFAVLLTINARLTLVVFALMPLMVVYALFFGKRMHVAVRDNRERIGDINAVVEQSLSGVRVVKSFANEETEMRKFARENDRFLDSRKNTYRNEAYLSGGIDAFAPLATVALLLLGGAGIAGGFLGLADLIAYLLYIGNLTQPIQALIHTIGQYQEGVAGFERFLEVLEVEPEAGDADGADDLEVVRGQVAFESVSFRYGPRHEYVLRDVSLEARPGDCVALVGSSGVGKTTLCSLIPRFYEVTEGRVLLDGKDVRGIRLDCLRRNVGVVEQDVYLFAGTVLENIRYGRPDADREQVVAAAKRAHAHDFIMQLPERYDTDIGQRGVKLSGGQQQRLSIARVFLKDPPILILDEATSALDSESERVVQESLEALARNRTTFIIAHRLSTVRNAQKIVVLADQGIVEQGTHGELVALKGPYARMVAAQFEGMDTGGGLGTAAVL